MSHALKAFSYLCYIFQFVSYVSFFCFQLGPIIASDLLELFAKGLNLEQFHLVGHSLGGQLVGVIGRSVTNMSKKKTVLRR